MVPVPNEKTDLVLSCLSEGAKLEEVGGLDLSFFSSAVEVMVPNEKAGFKLPLSGSTFEGLPPNKGPGLELPSGFEIPLLNEKLDLDPGFSS